MGSFLSQDNFEVQTFIEYKDWALLCLVVCPTMQVTTSLVYFYYLFSKILKMKVKSFHLLMFCSVQLISVVLIASIVLMWCAMEKAEDSQASER